MKKVNLPEVDHLLQVKKEHKRDIDNRLRQYAKSELCDELNEKFRIKTYQEQHQSNYTFSRITTWIGHGLSMLIGTVLAYQVSSWAFSSFDYPITDVITVGNVISVLASLAFLILLEWKKNNKGHMMFEKSFVQRDRPKGNREKLWPEVLKLAFVFLLSLAFNCYGAYKSVGLAHGEAPKEMAVVVDIAQKTAHIQASVDHWKKQVANMEQAQKDRAEAGKPRLYDIDTKKLPAANDSVGVYSAALAAAVTKWEKHNEKAAGNTTAKNDAAIRDHNESKEHYGLLGLALFALFDCVVLFGIYRQESYLWNCHKEMAALQAASQTPVKKSQVVVKESQNPGNDSGIPVISDNLEGDSDKVEVTVKVEKVDDEFIVVDEKGKEWTEKEIKNRISQAHSRNRKGTVKKETFEKNIALYEQYKTILSQHKTQNG